MVSNTDLVAPLLQGCPVVHQPVGAACVTDIISQHCKNISGARNHFLAKQAKFDSWRSSGNNSRGLRLLSKENMFQMFVFQDIAHAVVDT
jgi:hypothetical protein